MARELSLRISQKTATEEPHDLSPTNSCATMRRGWLAYIQLIGVCTGRMRGAVDDGA